MSFRAEKYCSKVSLSPLEDIPSTGKGGTFVVWKKLSSRLISIGNTPLKSRSSWIFLEDMQTNMKGPPPSWPMSLFYRYFIQGLPLAAGLTIYNWVKGPRLPAGVAKLIKKLITTNCETSLSCQYTNSNVVWPDLVLICFVNFLIH